LPDLAKIAKKYCVQDVQEGVRDVQGKRMFSTAGNIFSLQHRRMSVLIFTTFVFLKLNQELL
jgi:hypothetical protein